MSVLIDNLGLGFLAGERDRQAGANDREQTGCVPSGECPFVVGREVEQAALTAAVMGATRGVGGVIVVSGEAGIGKSRLVREAAEEASAAGMAVLWGAASGGDSPMPFRPLVEVASGAFRLLGDDSGRSAASAVDPFRPVLARLAPSAGRAAVADVNLAVLAEGLLVLLGSGRPKAGVVVLEDLHWADTDTVAVIEYLADHARDHGLLLLCTTRSDEQTAALTMARRLAQRRRATLVELARLVGDDAIAMARGCLGVADDEELTDGILDLVRRTTEGLPLLVEGLLTMAVRDGSLDRRGGRWELSASASVGVPAGYADTVGRRLSMVDDAAASTIRAASVFGQSFPWSLLGDMTDLDDDAVLAALRAAIDVGLVMADGDGFAFRHALTVAAVVDGLLPPDRVRLCRLAALALEAAHPTLPGQWLTIVADLYAGADDRDRAAALLADAGSKALSDGAVSTAGALLERAAALAGGLASLIPEARVALLEAIVATGDVDRAQEIGHALVDVLVGGPAAPMVDVHLLLARAQLKADPVEAASDVAAARALAAADVSMLARVNAVDALVTLETDRSDRLPAAEALARRATDGAEAAGLAEVACEALEVLGRCVRMRDLPAAHEVFARQLRIADAGHLTMWRIRALHELGTIDALRDLDIRRIREARDAAVEAGALTLAAGYGINVTAGHLLRGEYDEAAAAALACEGTARQFGLGPLTATAVAFQAAVAAHRGRRAEMERLLARLAPADRGDLAVTEWGFCRAVLALVEEDRPGALAACARADEAARRAPALMGNVSGGVWLLLRLVDGKAQPDEADDQDPDAFDVRWDRMHAGFTRAVALGRRGRADEAIAALSRGREAADPYPLHAHLYLRLAAEAALADGWGEPADWLVDVEAWSIGHGYPALTSTCRALLRKAGVVTGRGGSGEDGLPVALRQRGVTARELDVLRLLAARMTNPEIATRLYVSPRTVEKHVAALLRKLDAKSRVELGRQALANGWVPPMIPSP
jgi:DNA-binding CsgD family transcriptional regulator